MKLQQLMLVIIIIAVTIVGVTMVRAVRSLDEEAADCKLQGGALAKTRHGWACVVLVRSHSCP